MPRGKPYFAFSGWRSLIHASYDAPPAATKPSKCSLAQPRGVGGGAGKVQRRVTALAKTRQPASFPPT